MQIIALSFFHPNSLNSKIYLCCMWLCFEMQAFVWWIQDGGSTIILGTDDLSDADTEEALAEFDFLVSTSREGSSETRPVNLGEF